MQTIVITVSKNNPEDDILGLVEILAGQFKDHVVKVTDALVIETDVPQVAALFQALKKDGTPDENTIGGNGNKAKYLCIDCGKPVTKKGGRCGKCAARHILDRKKNKEVQDYGNYLMSKQSGSEQSG